MNVLREVPTTNGSQKFAKEKTIFSNEGRFYLYYSICCSILVHKLYNLVGNMGSILHSFFSSKAPNNVLLFKFSRLILISVPTFPFNSSNSTFNNLIECCSSRFKIIWNGVEALQNLMCLTSSLLLTLFKIFMDHNLVLSSFSSCQINIKDGYDSFMPCNQERLKIKREVNSKFAFKANQFHKERLLYGITLA